MDITLSSLTGYIYGSIALVVGVLFTIGGLLLALAYGFAGGALLIAGIALTIAGVVALPAVRNLLHNHAGIDFSQWAVGGIVGGLSVVASVLFVVALIGLAVAGGNGVAPGDDVTNVTTSAESVGPSGAQAALDVTWNARAQSAVNPNPDSMTKYSADDGEKYLVVRMQLTNAGDTELDLTPRLFQARISGVKYDRQALLGSSGGLSQVTLEPGASYDGWVVFSVPADASEGTLVVDQDAYYNEDVAVGFDHDPGMAINMSD